MQEDSKLKVILGYLASSRPVHGEQSGGTDKTKQLLELGTLQMLVLCWVSGSQT